MFEYDLFIRPDTCNPKYRVWFYFSVTNMEENQRTVFNVVNFSKLRNLFETGSASPVYREFSNDGVGEWQVLRILSKYITFILNLSRNRIPPKDIYYYRSHVHGDRFILSFAHVFKSVYKCEFAYCIPYTYSELQNYLIELDERHLKFYKREVLCNTVVRDIITVRRLFFSKNVG